MTKMAGVTPAKPPFAKNAVSPPRYSLWGFLLSGQWKTSCSLFRIIGAEIWLGCRKWGCNKWGGLRGVWPPVLEIGRNRPFSPFFCCFRPFLEGPKSTWKIQKTEEKGLFPQISSDFLKPPSLKPPFAALHFGKGMRAQGHSIFIRVRWFPEWR